MIEAPEAQRSLSRGDVLLLVTALLIVTILLGRGILAAGEFALGEDESRHAVTGMYFADFLSDLPLRHPVQYTYRYYAQYPALGLIHWPPFFHFVEGVAFRLAGPSPLVARGTVLGFALFGLVFWFLLLRKLLNREAATFGTLLLAFLPALLIYEQSVMLEVPSLALCLAATYFWIVALWERNLRALFWFAFLAALAMLTKQQSLYLLPFCALTAWTEGAGRWLLTWKAARAGALLIAMILPFYLVAARVHLTSIAEHVLPGPRTQFDPLFYFRSLASDLGWPVLLLSAVGLLGAYWWSPWRVTRVMLLWLAACYLSFTFLHAKAPRYGIYWLPVFIYFACWPLAAGFRVRRQRALAWALCAIVLATAGYSAWRRHPAYLSGYAQAARRISQLPGRNVLLFDGEENGNLIFALRAADPQRRFVVVRKGLYATRITPKFGKQELVHDPEGIEQLLADYGIRYILVTDGADYLFPVQQTLRVMLQGSQFKLMDSFPIISDRVQPHASRLLLYEFLQATRPKQQYLRVRMMTLSSDIVVPLKDLGIE